MFSKPIPRVLTACKKISDVKIMTFCLNFKLPLVTLARDYSIIRNNVTSNSIY